MASPTSEWRLIDLSTATDRIPSDQPVCMLNLLRFKSKATYAEEDSQRFEPCSGAEAYLRYRQSFGIVTKSLGITVAPVYVGQAHLNLVAGLEKGDTWDMIAVVKYPKFADFRAICEDETYLKDALPHRLAALEKFQLLATTEMK